MHAYSMPAYVYVCTCMCSSQISMMMTALCVVGLSMCTYMYACAYVYAYIYIHIYPRLYPDLHTHGFHTCMHAYRMPARHQLRIQRLIFILKLRNVAFEGVHIIRRRARLNFCFSFGLYVCMYVCIYVCMYVCMCVCVCVYVILFAVVRA
jgi:hypothetical protein